MSKDEQFMQVARWIDRLYAAAEQVVYETDVSLIDPFEIVSLINVRLHMEEINSKPIKKQKTTTAPNLVVFPTKKKDKDDTH